MMKRGLVAALAASGVLGGAAGAVEPSDTGWVSRPSMADFEAAVPPAARAGQGGRALARCRVEDDGSLSGCAVIRETPVREGYGEALLGLVPKYRYAAPGAKGARSVVIVGDWFRVDKNTDWARRPTPEDLMAVYPGKARGDGSAVINCLVTTQGALTDCEVLSERPLDSGFGNAAIALTPQFTMKPVTWKGAPARTSVSIPINWKGFTGELTRGPDTKRVVSAALPWTEAPTFADVAAAYPQKARDQKVGGHVVMGCRLSEEGRLTRCDVATSTPGGQGFDSAAKALAKKFLFAVGTDADRKATHSLEIHVAFTFDPAALEQAVIGKPNWAVLPSQAQVAEAFAGAGQGGVSRATLSCVVQPGGLVDQCAVTAEQPAGQGVGAGAMKLARAFRLTTWTNEGLPVVGGRITIPIRYEPPGTATPPK